jgi:hydroxylamine reductase
MYCYQCEQTGKGGCHTNVGVCGKDNKTAIFQDVLMFAVKGLAYYLNKMKGNSLIRLEHKIAIIEGLFTTVTNVNFDASRVKEVTRRISEMIDELRKNYSGMEDVPHIRKSEKFQFIDDDDLMLEFGETISIEKRKEEVGRAVAGVEELIIYGIKGLAAYADHAYILGYTDEKLLDEIIEVIDFMNYEHTIDELVPMALKVGELNYRVMELLDKANTNSYGHPVPTKVRITPIKGKAILVSGHDLKDLYELLKQTEGKGINIYTHGEMLPAHGYPELKKFKHLVGNYGGAWQDQQQEFDEFPGAILMTTNCIQKPRDSYKKRIFTSGLVAWEGVRHVKNYDFSELIEEALACEGFTEDGEEKYTMTGFAHNAVLGVADKVVEAVKNGEIKHFFLIGGCDGAKSGRNYYTEFATTAPKNTVILTLACGKYRFNKYEFGEVAGLPRLLDVGQCNDAYSAIKIAVALAEAFNTDVNSLPLSLILSWYEQKAVAILLTLLYLGIKNIKLGPSLPAFLEPEIVEFLVKTYNIAPITTVEQDMREILSA